MIAPTVLAGCGCLLLAAADPAASARPLILTEAVVHAHIDSSVIGATRGALWVGVRAGVDLEPTIGLPVAVLLGFAYMTSGEQASNGTSVVYASGVDLSASLLVQGSYLIAPIEELRLGPFLAVGPSFFISPVQLTAYDDQRDTVGFNTGFVAVGGGVMHWRFLTARLEVGLTAVRRGSGFLAGGGIGVSL